MKKPEEIKNGLEYMCITNVAAKVECAKRGLPYAYMEDVAADALSYIQQLESRLAQVERERDAAVHDLEELTGRVSSFHLDCDYCKDKDKPVCENCDWQWRGVCEENTKE